MSWKPAVGFYMDERALSDDDDSTRLLVNETLRLGHRPVLFSSYDLAAGAALPFGCGKPVPLKSLTHLVLRKDPPVDISFMEYLVHADSMPFMMNDPRMILADTKKYMQRFPEFQPKTYFVKSREDAYAAISSLGPSVVKPVDGFGGNGISIIYAGDTKETIDSKIANALAVDDELVVQQYLPEAKEGDKRVFVLFGDPVGATLRKPTGELCNIHAGGYRAPATVTPHEREVIAAMKDRLLADGGYFIGLDFIGGYVTECNSTSPGELHYASKWAGEPLERKVMGEFLSDKRYIYDASGPWMR